LEKISVRNYVLMNPTGNRTILVTGKVAKKDYKAIASELMKKEPTAEQVGFLDMSNPKELRLNMAGGEFCGNATMSAAVYAVLKGIAKSPVKTLVSGAEGELKAEVKTAEDGSYTGCVKMPSPVEIKNVKLKLDGTEMFFPAVFFDGITHVIASDVGIAKKKAEQYAKEWCRQLKVSCLGIMFHDSEKNKLKPLVYVKSPETLFWENSCGSGSVAVAAWLDSTGRKKDVHEFAEPGGRLKVERRGRSYYLEGAVSLEKEVNTGSEPDIINVQKNRIRAILDELDRQYGTQYRCYLNYETPWQLLFATIMSAQCTDERVNLVTKDLFVKYPDLEAFAKADLKELEQDIHSTGFYHNKAKNIIACAKVLLEKYNGEVPSDLESLTALPGVGRKTANVIRGNIYHIDSIVVDTHVKRISKKLGITAEEDPEKVEFDLMEKLPRDHWILYNIHIITLGRSICKAPTPKCEECFLKDLCPSYGKKSGK